MEGQETSGSRGELCGPDQGAGVGKGGQMQVLFGGRVNRICQWMGLTSSRKVTGVICSGHTVPVSRCPWEMRKEMQSLTGGQNKGHHLITGYLSYPLFTQYIPLLGVRFLDVTEINP